MNNKKDNKEENDLPDTSNFFISYNDVKNNKSDNSRFLAFSSTESGPPSPDDKPVGGGGRPPPPPDDKPVGEGGGGPPPPDDKPVGEGGGDHHHHHQMTSQLEKDHHHQMTSQLEEDHHHQMTSQLEKDHHHQMTSQLEEEDHHQQNIVRILSIKLTTKYHHQLQKYLKRIE